MSSPIQPKLTIGEPNDQYEQEADQVANQVVQQINSPPPVQPLSSEEKAVQTQYMIRQDPPSVNHLSPFGFKNSPPMIQQETMTEGDEEQISPKSVQRKENLGGGETSTDLEGQINSARGSGQPLDAQLQQSMGQAMGADFSGVRVHTDSNADQLNRSLSARAFTTGEDVFFKQGEYNPGSRGGQELIAHELTHVVQQTGGIAKKPNLSNSELDCFVSRNDITQNSEISNPKPTMQMKGVQINDDVGLEREADVMGGNAEIREHQLITNLISHQKHQSKNNLGLIQRTITFPHDSAVRDLNLLEKNAAKNAVGYAKNIANKAYKQAFLIKQDGDALTAYQNWFGKFTSGDPTDKSRWDKVKTIINKVLQVLDGNLEIYRANSVDPYLYAYVYPTSVGTIYLGQAFFRSYTNRATIDTTGGTILHEVTHFMATNDHAYGEHDCLSLAISDPDQAADNADNYLYFAEQFLDVRFER